MASLKFNHVFGLVMTGCVAASLFLKSETRGKVTQFLGTPLLVLFTPVTAQVQRGSWWLGDRMLPGAPNTSVTATSADGRTFDQLDAENAELRTMVLSLSTQLSELKQLNSDRAALGLVRERSVPARVVGADAGSRQMLQVETEPGVAIREGMAVISSRGLVGRIVGANPGTSGGVVRVKLTNDRESRVQGAFVRFVRDSAGNLVPRNISSPPPQVAGTGLTGVGALKVTNLSLKQLEQAGVLVGDVLVVYDTDFPEHLFGLTVGKVADITRSKTNPLMAELSIEPPTDFKKLKEVMIVNR